MHDIYNGEGYKRHLDFLSHPANVSLLLNTDGVAVYRSSNISIWPVWAALNELPPSLRCAMAYMLIESVYACTCIVDLVTLYLLFHCGVITFPFSSRFLRQYMLLLAIFYSKEKPVINMFLLPVIDNINVLYREGV